MKVNAKKSVGRPRLSEVTTDISARQEILEASAKLFAENGFKGTTTRKIADEVGIRQPSLFHYFKRKEDILFELVHTGSKDVLDYIEQVKFLGNPALSLYVLILRDCYFFMTEPLAINQLMNLPEVRNGKLKGIVDGTRAKSQQCYQQLVVAGIQEGQFIEKILDEVTANTLKGMSESLGAWYDKDGTKEHAVDTAIQIADIGLRSLLKSKEELHLIRDLALGEIGWSTK